MLLKKIELCVGGDLCITPEHMLFKLAKPTTGLSSSQLLGGVSTLQAVINKKLPPNISTEQDLEGGSMEKFFAITSKKLGVDNSSVLLTSASMECFGYHKETYKDIVVEAFATAGVDGNAARAGELPQYRETKNGFVPVGGTINVVLFFSFALSQGSLVKALITLTEAKSALLDEMGVFSIYDKHTATGTSTDGAIIVANDFGHLYTDVGTHSYIGYMIATATKNAIAKSLLQECFWNGSTQISASKLLKKHAGGKHKRIVYQEKFNKLNFYEQQQLLEALNLWHILEEKRAFGGVFPKGYLWFEKQLFEKYPILNDWL